MGVFDNCSVLLELKHLSFKEKKQLRSAVTENGGSISFVINKQCSLVVTSDVSNLSSNRLRSIQKHHTPVVGLDYVHSCVERGALLPVDGYKLEPSCSSPDPLPLNPPRRAPATYRAKNPTGPVSPVPADGTKQGGFRIYKETDSDLPAFPDEFQVAKYSFFEKVNSSTRCVLELQSARTEQGQRYRVVRYWKDDVAAKKVPVKDQLVFLSTSEKALDVYEALTDQLDSSGLQKTSSVPAEVPDLGSAPLQQLLLEEKLNTGSLSQEVAVFVEMLWTEALGCLSNILRVSINRLSLNDVSRAEGLLLQAQKKLKEGNHSEVSSLLNEVYILLPFREPQPPFPAAKFLSQKLDLCQLIRDVLNVSEMNLWNREPSCVGKYRALQCSIEAVPPNSNVFQNVASLLHDSPVQIHQIMRVSRGRGVEQQTFKRELGNIKPLLHSSSPSNFVGILSRGLLLPRVGVEHHGIERTDVGNLGSGIYFSDALSTSLKYSKPSETDGSRLLLVCDVALGRSKKVFKRDQTLSQAPEGHHSVHGVRRTHTTQSDFEDDEFVVYSPDQVKIKYVVLFTVEGDHLKDFQPAVNTSVEPDPSAAGEELISVADDIENIKNPLEDVTAGLLDSSGQQLPLQAVHVKCKLMDLLSQVIIFQKYTNLSSVPIEAKYVFPLDDSAAVCGFEAFINGKHVVGQVKEKETARKEYKQAIEKGHGAYLMDQDAPDVFTISVGNLPPGATVLVKVTFVSEVVVRDGSIVFSLPGSVAPWQESAALNQTTQVSVEKVCVTDEAAGSREFTLDMSVEMPYEISNLLCITHQVMIKKTDCKAVVRILPGQVMGPDGFQLSITLSEVHLPRMWVEKHPDKDSQACMLVFYPDFELDSGSEADEVVLLLDTSASMRGESCCLAQNIALQVLKKLESNVRVNIVLFGTDHTEAFLRAQPLSEVRQAAETFIKRCSPAGGSTELWRPLRALSLLPPSRGVRNLLLLSDGHIQNGPLTLQLLRDNAQHSRLFTCGLSPTANRHMLRALAQAGGGAYEFFDTKTKHNWAEKVLHQVKRMSAPGCSSVSVKWQQFNPTAPLPVQAPKQLHALFSDCHTLVYGFVPHCTQATLLGNLHGQELKTMVSTTELQKTRGTFLHKLTARALIRDYEDGSLDTTEAEHEGKKAELKSFIIELSKEFSILSQFTSFVAIEERDSTQPEDGITDIPKLVAEEDVDFLPYISWTFPQEDQEPQVIDYDFLDDSGSYEEMEEAESYEEMEEAENYEGLRRRSKSPRHLGFSTMSWASADAASFYCAGVPKKVRAAPSRDYSPASPSYTPTSASLGASVPASGLFGSAFNITGFEGSVMQGTPFGSARSPGFSAFNGPTPRAAPEASVPGSRLSDLGGLADHGAFKVQSGLFGSAPAAGYSPMLPSYTPTPAIACGASEAPSRSFSSPSSPDVFGFLPATLSVGAPLPAADRAPCSEQGPKFLPEVQLHSAKARDKFSGRRVSERSSPLPARLALADEVPQVDSLNRLLSPRASNLLNNISRRAPSPQWHSEVPQVGSDDCLSYDDDDTEFDSLYVFQPSCARAVPPPPPPLAADISADVFLDASASPPPPPPPHAADVPQVDSLNGLPPRRLFIKNRMHHRADESLEGVCLDASLRPSPHDAEELLPTRYCYEGKKRKAGKKIRIGSSALLAPTGPPSAESRDPDPEELKHKWTKIFQLQHSDGFWELTTELGDLINLNVDVFVNGFLRNKGISSLGMKAHADILRMVATLLVLQLLRMEKQEEGKLLQSLFRLDESSQLRPERWEQVKKAMDWMCWADRQYPCICSRLELGLNWESTTRQLLGFDSVPPFSPLIGLKLRATATPLPLYSSV